MKYKIRRGKENYQQPTFDAKELGKRTTPITEAIWHSQSVNEKPSLGEIERALTNSNPKAHGIVDW
jgi:hypothetical protein